MCKIKQNIVGEYKVNGYTIVLPATISVIGENTLQLSECNSNDLATLLHEYFHYILNISSFNGIRELNINYSLKSLFSYSLISNNNGTSTGVQDLSAEQINDYNSISSIEYLYNGDFLYSDDDSKLAISKIYFLDNSFEYHGKIVPFKTTVIQFIIESTDGIEVVDINFGHNSLEEAFCNSLEEAVLGCTSNNIAFPYHIISLIVSYLKVTISKKVLCYLAFMSLQTTNATFSFINALILLKNNQDKGLETWNDESFQLDYFKLQFLDIFKKIYLDLLKTLEELENSTKGRFGTQFVTNYICELSRNIFSIRNVNLAFDLDIIFDTSDLAANINRLFSIIKPCDIIIKNKNPSSELNKDIYVTFDQNLNVMGSGFSFSELLRMFDCENHFVYSHIEKDLIKSTATLGSTICPNFNFCESAQRLESPTICSSKPWFEFRKSNCWYSSGILSLFGVGSVKPIGN